MLWQSWEIHICGRLEDEGKVLKLRCVLFCLSLEETWCPCVFTGEELCTGLKRACSLDCPFGFLTDAHNCEICQCRPRPKKCRPIICDKYCPFGYLYVFLNSEDLFFIVSNLVNESVVCWVQKICACFVRWIRKQGKGGVSTDKNRVLLLSFMKVGPCYDTTLEACYVQLPHSRGLGTLRGKWNCHEAPVLCYTFHNCPIDSFVITYLIHSED